jgi:hypothetical protein
MRTTISLSPETRERIKQHGKLGETHEDVIIKLLNFYEKMSGDKNE